MKTLFRNIRIVDPLSPRNGEILDLLFDNGKILLNGEECSTIIEAEGWSVSPGRVDLKSDIGEPGNEEAESYSSFAEAAQAGGYVAACTTPLRLPVTDSAPAVANLIQKSVGGKVRLMPIAAATKGGLGKELSEYFDLRNAGAVMVSDDTRLLNHSHLIKVALQYSKTADVILSLHPLDPDLLVVPTHINESLNTLMLGMTGVDAMAETIALRKLIRLMEYTEAPLHIDAISCAESLAVIEKAKKKGLPVTCSVNAANLLWSDESLLSFENCFKLWPPLRNEADRKALISGVKSGVIDAICSDHRPHSPESIDCEFEAAPYGALQIQTVYSALHTFVPDLTDDVLCRALYYGPLTCLRLTARSIDHNAELPLVFYRPDEKWSLNTQTNKSRSSNSALWETELTGKTKFTTIDAQIFTTDDK